MAFDVEGKVTHDRETVDAAFRADPSQRLTVPPERRARTHFALILAACLAAHALLLTILVFEDFSAAPEPARAEEIPVEIVAELPPEQKALPPPPDLVTPPVVKEKPPPEKVHLDDVAVAHDAPVAGDADQTHKGDPDKETKSPKTVAQQLAALSPAPNYSIGAAAKAAPISGGTEKASYESLLMGLISRQVHLPPELRAQHLIAVGQIGLFVDELGHLTHQAFYQKSGEPALDAAWMAAVRRAAPFPAPPRGLPHSFILQYTNEN